MKLKVLLIASCLLMTVVITGCGKKTTADGDVVFTAAAAKNTDSKINVEMLKLLVENKTNNEVKLVEDLPASPQIFAGIDRGDFDFASLFSGEVYNNYFDDVTYTTDPEKTLKQAQTLFGKKYDIKWYDPIGYINNYGIAVKKKFAKKHNITNLTELGKFADDLVLGTDNAWIERDNDGYKGYQKTYNYKFSDARGMDVALMYKGIASDELNVVTAYTVDPQIKQYDLKVLDDDKQFFPPYQASLVARNKIAKKYPKVDKIIQSTVGLIDTEEMTNLIYQVDIKKKSVEEVTKTFLKDKGMLD